MFPAEYDKVAAAVDERHLLIAQAEMDILGCTHFDVGRLLAERWNLPAKLTHVIGRHHEPVGNGTFGIETAIVHVADIFTRGLDLGSGGDERIPPLDHGAWNKLGLSAMSLDPIMASMLSDFEDIRSFLR
jgi:HD-like signal output (HDOD) protein